MQRRAAAPLLAAIALAYPAAADEILMDGIAAQVGTEIVLVSEVLEVVGPNEAQLRQAGAPEAEIAKLRAEGLELMIEARLMEKVVQDLELYATDAEIDETIQAIADENGLTVDQLKRTVTRQNMSYDEYRASLKRELEKRKVISALVSSKVHVEENEVEALYKERFSDQPQGGNQVHLRQILIPAGKEVQITLEQACGMVQELRQRIGRGESFEELATRFSAAAPGQGGDIGWLHEETLAGWMNDLIGPLQDGEVSQVAQLPFGCTIVKLVERKGYEPVSFEQARAKLYNEVYETKVSEAYREWIEELREKTFIERQGYFADAARFGESPFDRASPREKPTTP